MNNDAKVGELRLLDSYTEDELAGMEEAEVRALIERELLEAGIPLEDIEEPEPVIHWPEQTEKAFKVGLLAFAGMETASQVAAMPMLDNHYMSGLPFSASTCYYEPLPTDGYERRVQVVPYAKKSVLEAAVPRLKEEIEIHEAWEEREKTRTNTDKERQEIASRVWNAVARAQVADALCRRYAVAFNRYLETAGGNETVALRFIRLAYGDFTGRTEEKALAYAAEARKEVAA